MRFGEPRGPSVGEEAVYTDIDGTVTRSATIFGLLAFDGERSGRTGEAQALAARLRAAAAAGVPREQTSREYFSWWAGRAEEELHAVGRQWADAQAASGERLFHPAMEAALDAHRAAGQRLVAVTASFRPALESVARRWPTMHIIAAEPVLVGGILTGDVREPLIGVAKARAVRTHAAAQGIDLSRSAGYGDHPSDLPFLRLLGEYSMVRQDGSVETQATRDMDHTSGTGHVRSSYT